MERNVSRRRYFFPGLLIFQSMCGTRRARYFAGARGGRGGHTRVVVCTRRARYRVRRVCVLRRLKHFFQLLCFPLARSERGKQNTFRAINEEDEEQKNRVGKTKKNVTRVVNSGRGIP